MTVGPPKGGGPVVESNFQQRLSHRRGPGRVR